MNRRLAPIYLLSIMLFLLLGCVVIAANAGALRLTMFSLWQQPIDHPMWNVWFNIRLPRVLLAVLVGAALAVSGSVMQGLFRNPLADPGLLGISSGGALMVALMIVFPLTLPLPFSLYSNMLAAFAGSFVVCLFIYSVSHSQGYSLAKLLLTGIAINALCVSALGLLTYISNDQQLRQISLWSMGSLVQAQWLTVGIVATALLPAVFLTFRLAHVLNLLQLGDEEAHYLGVNVASVKRQLLVLSALFVGAAVAVSGIIGFIGLVVPHLIRMSIGADHRWLLPGSALGGALLLLSADTLARTFIAPAELPVGLLTSLIGGPYFLWLVLRKREKSYA